MKICKDCKHSVWSWTAQMQSYWGPSPYHVAMCGRSDAPRSLVTGDLTVSCMDTRREGAECGPDGDLFEERPPEVKPYQIIPVAAAPEKGFWATLFEYVRG